MDCQKRLGPAYPIPRRSPLDNLRDLEDAVSYGRLLTTTQIEKLLGVKPRGEQFDRQGFVFTRQGKAGREAQWSVEKNRLRPVAADC